MTIIKDLEDFVYRDIICPYWPLTKQPKPSMHEATPDYAYQFLLEHQDDQIGGYIIGRLCRMQVIFPSWICHPLVDLVTKKMQEREAESPGFFTSVTRESVVARKRYQSSGVSNG